MMDTEKKMETIDDIAKIEFLGDKDLEISKTKGGFLSLKVGDDEYKRVCFQRAYPLSKPDEFIVVRQINDKRDLGDEIGVILNINDISDEKREMVEEDLALRYHTPIILSIKSLKDEYGYVYMNLETSAGAKNVTAPNSSTNFIRLTETRILIVDMDGNRYEIKDYMKLDNKSIRFIENVI